MKILACFKIVPDLEQVLVEDWNNFNLETDLSYVRKIFNCFDESALEITIRLKEQAVGDCEIVALTAGAKPPASFVKTLYAVGFNRVIWLDCEHSEFVPSDIGREIGKAIKDEQFDLILTGEQAGLGDNGTTPHYIAHSLGYPVISGGASLEWAGENLLVNVPDSNGITCLTAQLPLVVTIGNSPVSVLRSATIMEQMRAGKKPLEEKSAKTVKMAESLTFYQPCKKGQCEMWSGEDLNSAAEKLIELINAGGEQD